VIVAFTDLTAGAFVGCVILENGDSVLGGGIASSSLMYLLLPIMMGVLIRKTGISENKSLIIFLPLVGLSIYLGQIFPIYLPFDDIATQQKTWGIIILVYCVIAALLPM